MGVFLALAAIGIGLLLARGGSSAPAPAAGAADGGAGPALSPQAREVGRLMDLGTRAMRGDDSAWVEIQAEIGRASNEDLARLRDMIESVGPDYEATEQEWSYLARLSMLVESETARRRI